MDELPWVLLGLRTVPKDDLGALSAEMVYGAPLTIPGDFIAPPPDICGSCATVSELWPQY